MIDNILVANYGDIKTAKTTFALSMPTPMIDFDFDQSFGRVYYRFKKLHPNAKIKIVPEQETLTDQILDGSYDLIIRKYKQPLRFPGRQATGFLDLWDNKVIPDFLKTYEAPAIKSVMVDTGSILWEMAHQAHLERVQQSSSAHKKRQNLIQIEYARPNGECRALYQGARSNNKSMVSVNHLGIKYGMGIVEETKGNKTEKVIKNDIPIGETWKGFGQLGQIVDVVVRSRLEQRCSCGKTFDRPHNGVMSPALEMEHGKHEVDPKPLPTITIEECGYSLEAQGIKLENPTYTGLVAIMNAMGNNI